MKFAANVSMLYPDRPLLSRLAAARQDGFDAVEILFPYQQPAAELARELRANGLTLALINTPLGPQGERGLAGLPGREREFRAGFEQARAVAGETGCRTIHVMAGFPGADMPRDACFATLDANLQWACAAAGPDLTLTLEALNHLDMPGYLYAQPEQAAEVIRRLAQPRLRLQFDFFHAAREQLPLLASVQALRPLIHHLQIAGMPDRHEPDLRFPQLLESLQWLMGAGYGGWLGFEYTPRGDTSAGLAWRAPLRP